MSSSLVKLSVGGVPYTTTKETLIGPFFSAMFSERWLAPTSGNATGISERWLAPTSGNATGISERMAPGLLDDGRIFIDRSGQLFEHVLNYLRNAERWIPPTDPATLASLLNEALYYGLDGMVDKLKPYLETKTFAVWIGYGADGFASHVGRSAICPLDIVSYWQSLAGPHPNIKIMEGQSVFFAAYHAIDIAEKCGYRLCSEHSINISMKRNDAITSIRFLVFSLDAETLAKSQLGSLLPSPV